jgi:dTDP-4-dehydrorhamnose reductase
MADKTILVIGANGQLGSELRVLASSFPQYNFIFVSREELAIDDAKAVKTFFKNTDIDCCINCAAYTAVDKAESERDKAFSINGEAVGNLAKACKEYGTRLIHVSTDYVFDGAGKTPYKEHDPVDPINTYGASKLKGEELAMDIHPSAIIIRTSWVFSSFGNNFVKTMLRLMSERESINVVNDQKGCPTYAADLAKAIMNFVEEDNENLKGIYNFCNEGVTTWYDFASAIKQKANKNCAVNPIPSIQFPTPAKRPGYSVLNTSKIREALHISIPHWENALERCLALITI